MKYKLTNKHSIKTNFGSIGYGEMFYVGCVPGVSVFYLKIYSPKSDLDEALNLDANEVIAFDESWEVTRCDFTLTIDA